MVFSAAPAGPWATSENAVAVSSDACSPPERAVYDAAAAPAPSYYHPPEGMTTASHHPYGVTQPYAEPPTSYSYHYRYLDAAASTSHYYHHYYQNASPNVGPSPLLRYELASSAAAAYETHSLYGGSYAYSGVRAALAGARGELGGLGKHYGLVPPRGDNLIGTSGRIFGFDPHIYAQTVSARSVPSTPTAAHWNHLDGPPYLHPAVGRPTKKRRSSYCEVCKVDCNTTEVLETHKQGKRHRKNLEKLQEAITPKPKSPANLPEEADAEQPKDGLADGKPVGEPLKNKPVVRATEEELEVKKKRVLEAGASVQKMRICTVCNIVVNNQKVYDAHLAGSKHAAMVKELQGDGDT